jgi:hypothetical protein
MAIFASAQRGKLFTGYNAGLTIFRISGVVIFGEPIMTQDEQILHGQNLFINWLFSY